MLESKQVDLKDYKIRKIEEEMYAILNEPN